jgi:tetratricopeptide (TPR) repeat protein
MTNRIFAILALVAVISGCATASGDLGGSEFNEAKYTLNYNAGLNHLANNQPTFAMEKFLEAEKYKKTPDLYYSMGQVCFMLNRDDLALTYFEKSLALDQKFSSSNVGKGIVLRQKGLYDEAIAEFNKALDNIVFHEPEVAYFNIALTYLAMNNPNAAVSYLKSAIQVRPEFLPSYYQLALVYMNLKSYDAAADVTRRLLTYAPDLPEAHLLLGRAYLKLEKTSSAVAEFKEVIRLAPDSDYAREARGYLMGGDN